MAKTQRLEFDEEDDDNDNRSSMSGVSDTISSSPLLREGSSISFTPKKTSSLVFDSSTQSTSSKYYSILYYILLHNDFIQYFLRCLQFNHVS